MGCSQKQRQRVHVQGVVQGVGFRPFVYGLAASLGLTGFVGNDSSGVFIEVEGSPTHIESFIIALKASPPPLAHIDHMSIRAVPVRASGEFQIVASQARDKASTLISPDLSICAECLHELFDPDDRRFGYPFINCTNCGPRFTITKDIPYDRPLTTMASFTMCATCRAEYDDPLNRRFHAQPNACAACGPHVWFATSGGMPAEVDDPIGAAQRQIAQGGIVVVKGLGGFHLACDATNAEAVEKLRLRKGRANKPFAIMVADLASAQAIAQLDEHEEALLTSRQRPIVLLKKRAGTVLADGIASGNGNVGVMLPYTPLHYLLLRRYGGKDPRPDVDSLRRHDLLVMTSANFSNQPIIKENDEALEKLAPVTDAFLLHDRDIHVHCDDSVIRIFRGIELPLRRSRGYAPFPVRLPFAVRPTLAVGGELKSTFCLANGTHAFMSQHIGDMQNLETLIAFSHSVAHFEQIFGIDPEIVAHDLHPGYLSTRWVYENCAERTVIPVQHHHAHIAAVMAENGVARGEQVIGFAFDGTGYGHDHAIWGGEVFVASYLDCQRVAHLATVPLPGGDAAIRKPHRMALAHLWAAGIEWDETLPPVAACSPAERRIIKQQLIRHINTVETSSMGRLFDAVAALAGVRQEVTYEAQAAIEFEALADVGKQGTYTWLPDDHFVSQLPAENAKNGWLRNGKALQISATPIIRAVVADIQRHVAPSTIATRFHRGVAAFMLRMAQRIRLQSGLNHVALSGGVFQNVLLLEIATDLLEANDFYVLTHRQVPPNDGGLALGQAVIANCIDKESP